MSWWQKLIVDSIPILLGIFAHWLGVQNNGKAPPPTVGGGA